jgi:hypothetical protein
VIERIVAAELAFAGGADAAGDVASERDLAAMKRAAADPRRDECAGDDVLEFTPLDGLTGEPLTAA